MTKYVGASSLLKKQKQIFFYQNYLVCKIIFLHLQSFCGCGVIGSRTRLRIWRREAWGFESLHPHQTLKTASAVLGVFSYICQTGQHSCTTCRST